MMLLVIAALFFGDSFAACPDITECNGNDDLAAMLQVNSDVVRPDHEKSGHARDARQKQVRSLSVAHASNSNEEVAPAPKEDRSELALELYMVDIDYWDYALQGSVTAAHRKTRSTQQVVTVCSGVIVALAFGWTVFWRVTKSGVELQALQLFLFCCSFGACSWAMNVLNITLVQNLQTPTLVTAAQMFMTVIGALILVRDKLTGTRIQCLKWSIIPLFFCGMLVSSFFTYRYLTLSMLMVIRNVSPLVTLPIESVVMAADRRPYVTNNMILALLVVLISTFAYCQKLEVSDKGVLFALLNMLLAIADRVAQRRLLTTECKDLPTETCMFLNNSFGLVPCVLLAFAFGEFSKVNLSVWFGSLSTVLLIFSGVIGTGICYFALAVQREITAASFMVLQNSVRMAVVLFGVVVFLDPIGWPFQVIGLILSFVGAFAYGLAHLQGQAEFEAKKAEEQEALKASKAGIRISYITLDEGDPIKTGK
jgi:drug/metabolite transporter (DMT)-like permease